MKKYKVGIIGNGFVGESQAFAFSPTCDILIYDKNPLKSVNSIEEVLKSDAYKYVVNSQRQLFSKVDGISNIQKPVVDLFCENENGKIILIELKKDELKVLDVYQLLMYHDGYVYDKDKSPDETWLIAEKKPKWAASLLEYINTLKDQKNNKYNLQIKTYDDFRHHIRR